MNPIKSNTVGCLDFHLKSFHEFSVSSNCSEFKKLKVIPFYEFNFSVIKTAYNQYIGTGAYENEMFTLFDANGKKINAFFEYPYKDNFVYSSSFADIIHFYEIKKNEITTIKKIENSYPEYITEEKNGGISAPIKSTNKHGYICAYATDNYIYLLYSGKSYSEYPDPAIISFDFK